MHTDQIPGHQFLTSLDTEETAVEQENALLLLENGNHGYGQHFARRHMYARDARVAVYRALTVTGAPLPVRWRFLKCGGEVWVIRNTADNSKYRFAPQTCRHRLCPACAREKAARIAERLKAAISPAHTRFITLTLKSGCEPLSAILFRLRRAFRRLRSRALWKDRVHGAVAFTEIKLNADPPRWHVHYHILAHGRYIPQADLSREWLACTGDSQIVDIRMVRRTNRAVEYVTKYAGKSLDYTTISNPRALCEAITGLKHHKLILTLGAWRKLKLCAPAEPESEWERVGHVNEYLVGTHRDPYLRQIVSEIWCMYAAGRHGPDFEITPGPSPPD